MIEITKENKYYFLLVAGAIIYAITSALQTTVFKILHVTNTNLIPIMAIIYQAVCIMLGILYVLIMSKLEIKKLKERLKEHAIGATSIILYLVLSATSTVPLKLLHINVQMMSKAAKIIYSLSYELIILLLLISINKTKIKRDIKDIKINHKKYFKENIKYWFFGLIIMYVANFLIQFVFVKSLPNNEEILREQFQLSPIYIYISAVLIGPFMEEIVFRRSFKNLIKNEYIFMITSGLVFGAMHAFNTDKITLLEILYLIPYSAPGIMFAKMLNKTDNIFVSTAIHMLHNGILIGLQFIMYFYV